MTDVILIDERRDQRLSTYAPAMKILSRWPHCSTATLEQQSLVKRAGSDPELKDLRRISGSV